MLGRLNHVGVAVPSLEEGVERYRRFFGDMPMSQVIELPEQGVRVRFLDAPNGQIELLEPLTEDGPVG
jgi:methylmalonyl-CoA/ethylmalonyl-CoA epimerase